ISGTLSDCWQGALEDIGPAGADKGRGGKYLILPPDYDGEVPHGYLTLPSPCFHNYGVLRSALQSRDEADVERAVAYARRIQLYPLERAEAPPETTFVDVADVVFDGTIPYDL